MRPGRSLLVRVTKWKSEIFRWNGSCNVIRGDFFNTYVQFHIHKCGFTIIFCRSSDKPVELERREVSEHHAAMSEERRKRQCDERKIDPHANK